MEGSSFLCHLDARDLKRIPSLYSSRHFGKPLRASINTVIHPASLPVSPPHPQTEVQTRNSGEHRLSSTSSTHTSLLSLGSLAAFRSWHLAESLKASASLVGAALSSSSLATSVSAQSQVSFPLLNFLSASARPQSTAHDSPARLTLPLNKWKDHCRLLCRHLNHLNSCI